MINTILKNKWLFAVWFVIVLVISASVVTSTALCLVAFAFFMLAALFIPESDVVVLLIGLMPYANIFKLGAGSVSLFTICEVFVVLLLIYKRNTISRSLFVSLSAIFVYFLFLSFDNLNLMIIIKVLLAFLLVHYAIVFIGKKDVKNIAYLLSVGTLIMMLLSLNEEYLNYLFPYYEDINYSIDSSGSVTETLRASGFLGDPNYCAILIIVVLSLLCMLYYYRDIGVDFWFIAVPLATTGIYTYSKSYFLCLVTLMALLLLFILFPKHKGWAVLSIMALFVLVFLIISGEIETFNILLDRFETGDLTTGRSELNNDYLEYIFSNNKVMLFGEGITVDRFEGALNNVHNIYIELLYKMGFVGTAMYIMSWFAALKKSFVGSGKRKIVNYLPMIFVGTMFFFLAGITDYALPFYIIIASVCYNYNKLDA